jgi:hypothetical protein
MTLLLLVIITVHTTKFQSKTFSRIYSLKILNGQK